jgi:hypothetical protein
MKKGPLRAGLFCAGVAKSSVDQQTRKDVTHRENEDDQLAQKLRLAEGRHFEKRVTGMLIQNSAHSILRFLAVNVAPTATVRAG